MPISGVASIPPIQSPFSGDLPVIIERIKVLGHLNLYRDTFRRDFPNTRFVFLLPKNALNLLILYAQDFFDFRSGVIFSELLEDMELKNLKVLKYEIECISPIQSIVLVRRPGMDIERWSINRGDGVCLSKLPNQNGLFEFVIEKNPSSRDEEYYQQHRFDSAEDALKFWNANKKFVCGY